MNFNADPELATGAPQRGLQSLAADQPHPGWVVLDAARTSRFIGEIVFHDEPEIRAYFDNGMAYHAVRDGDASLCEQLVDAGTVQPSQIDRGVVRVGDVEHLGRLFDRDSSIDRDAVTVVVELATDDVLTELARRESCTFDITPYRHHVSGVHRWFVAPTEPVQLAPVGQVAQIDGSVTSNLPGLPVVERNDAQDDVHIEWDQPTIGEPPVKAAPTLHELDESLLKIVLDEASDPLGSLPAPEIPDGGMPAPEMPAPSFAAPAAVAPEPLDVDSDLEIIASPVDEEVDEEVVELLGLDDIVISAPMPPRDEPDAAVEFNDEFQIVWPDGTEQVLPPSTGDEAVVYVDRRDDELEIIAGPSEDASVAVEQFADERAVDPEPVTEPFEALPAPMLSVDSQDRIEHPLVLSDPPLAGLVTPGRVAVTPSDSESEIADPAPALTQDDAGDFRLNMPPLALSADLTPADQQPEEVVDAVRRALAAIEAASTTATLPSLPETAGSEPFADGTVAARARDSADGHDPLAEDHGQDEIGEAAAFEIGGDFQLVASPFKETADADVELDPVTVEVDLDVAPAVVEGLFDPSPGGAGAAEPSGEAGSLGFAAPTLDSSAEAIYARAAAESGPTADREPAASRAASVVFVDDEADEDGAGEGPDRTGALRRLIGSLRRK